MVLNLCIDKLFCDSKIADLRLETPEVTALILINFAFMDCDNKLARVVFPLPGGPHSINEGKVPFAMLWSRGLFGPTISFCPTNESKLFGLILEANGEDSFKMFSAL